MKCDNEMWSISDRGLTVIGTGARVAGVRGKTADEHSTRHIQEIVTMNFIKTLQQQLASKTAELDQMNEGLTELECYLTSSKFHVDTTVQVRDVLTRIREIRTAAITSGMVV